MIPSPVSALSFLTYSLLCLLSGHACPVEQRVEFRDTLKPDSMEAIGKRYQVIKWQDSERDTMRKHLAYIHEKAPGLLTRGLGAKGEKIRLYRAKLPNYAKGGSQLIVLDEKVFPNRGMDWSRRIVIHELCHTADHYRTVSNSKVFRKIIEPKIVLAIELLKKENLTPRTAAALPLGARRKRIESLIRNRTGLPSAYACTNLSECLAEITSFWIDDLYEYTPPAQLLPLIQSFTRKTAPNPASLHFQKAEKLFVTGKYKSALAELNTALKSKPDFYQALALRGHTYERLKKPKAAARDMRETTKLISRYEHGASFYYSEWKRLQSIANATP